MEDVTEYTTMIVVILLQFKDGISIDYQQDKKIEVKQDANFELALLHVKPVSMGQYE